MSKNLRKVIWGVLILGLVGMASFAYYVYHNVFESNTAFQNEEAHLLLKPEVLSKR